MNKERAPSNNASEPILEINEFETEAESILALTQKEAAGIIQEAKDKAEEIVQREKQTFVAFQKEYLEKIEDQIRIEKEKLISRNKEELKHIRSISSEKIEKAVDFVLERVLP